MARRIPKSDLDYLDYISHSRSDDPQEAEFTHAGRPDVTNPKGRYHLASATVRAQLEIIEQRAVIARSSKSKSELQKHIMDIASSLRMLLRSDLFDPTTQPSRKRLAAALEYARISSDRPVSFDQTGTYATITGTFPLDALAHGLQW